MRNWTCRVIALLIVAWWTAPAHAADVEARLTPGGLDFIATELPAFLPTSMTFGGGTLWKTGCPWGDDFAIGVSNVRVTRIDYKALKASTGGGKVTITIDAANIKADGDLNVTHSLCVGGALNCDFNVTVTKARVTASFVPQIQGRTVKLVDPAINSSVAAGDVSIAVASCGMAGEILDKVESVIHGWFVDQIKGWLEGMARTQLPPEVEKLLSSFTSLGGAAAGYKAEATIQAVDAGSDGLDLRAKIALTNTVTASCTQAPAPAPATSGSSSPTFAFQGEHLGLALAESTVKNALIAAWKAGLLCHPYSSLKAMGWNDQLGNGAGVLLGLQGVTSVDVNAPKPPGVNLVAGTPGRAEATLPGFEVVIKGQGPNGPVTITVTADVSLDAELGVDGENRSVSLVNAEAKVSNLKLDVDKPEGLLVSEALFGDLLADVVLPLVESKMAGLAFLPHVFSDDTGPLAGYYLYLTRSITTGSYAYLYAKLFKKNPTDKTAPSTMIVTKPPALLKPQLYKILADGTDNSTPAELLRFKWRSGLGSPGAWSAVGYARARTIELVDGKNVVEVQAIDLNNNSDASPAKLELTVDGKAPTLTVEPPPATVTQPSLRLSFAVSDEHTPANEIKVMLQLKHEAEAGREEVVREDPFIKGVQAVELGQLVRGRYTVTLVAEDGVGNKSMPVNNTFTVELPEGVGGNPAQPGGTTTWEPAPGNAGGVSGGCRMGGGPSPPAWPLLLLALAMAVRRRRASR